MKSFIWCVSLVTSLMVSNAAYALITCQKATVDVGGGSSGVEYICSDDTTFLTAPPVGRYMVLTPDDGGGPATPFPAKVDKAICGVNKYTDPKYSLKSAYKIEFVPFYGWESATGDTQTVTSAAPPGGPWTRDAGSTTLPGELPSLTVIFAAGYQPTATKTALQEMIITLGHEAAHQNGVRDEPTAEAIGQAALNAYNADGGAKCD
jgi:hypothetical protein